MRWKWNYGWNWKMLGPRPLVSSMSPEPGLRAATASRRFRFLHTDVAVPDSDAVLRTQHSVHVQTSYSARHPPSWVVCRLLLAHKDRSSNAIKSSCWKIRKISVPWLGLPSGLSIPTSRHLAVNADIAELGRPSGGLAWYLDLPLSRFEA
jgi:hypothetical protein